MAFTVAYAIRNSSRGARKCAQNCNLSDVKAAKENESLLGLLTRLNAATAHLFEDLIGTIFVTFGLFHSILSHISVSLMALQGLSKRGHHRQCLGMQAG